MATSRRTPVYAEGRLEMHREGYGFLIAVPPVTGISGDVFLPPDAISGAMHGDRVRVRVRRIDARGRAEGVVERILKREHPAVVGEFRITSRGCFLIPHDQRLQDWIEIPPGMELPASAAPVDRIGVAPTAIETVEDLNGLVVNVELLEFPSKGERAAGRVIEILGKPDDFGVDVEIVIRKHHLPHRFPPDVLEQAEAIPESITARELDGRRDFRRMEVVTIDWETARDFDDAVRVARLANGNCSLDVHIADVSHYVRPGSPVDVEARLRGTSVYFPDRAVPMLPAQLSTGICSLNPRVDRLVLSALLEIDNQGDVVRHEIVRGVIRSAERMTYTDVHLLLEGDTALRERYKPLVEQFELMRELAMKLNRKRVKRGAIDFDLPEPLVEFDEFGEMTGVTRSPRNIAHRIIEEFMLAANEVVAAHLEEAAPASIYRIHEPPDPTKVMEFEEIAAHFGHTLGIGPIPVQRFGVVDRKREGRRVRKDVVLADPRLRITSRHYQKLIAKIEGQPEERIVSYLMLRSLKQARYSTDNAGHFALAAAAYTHFTSPIRRYPDLVVHRLLDVWLDGNHFPPGYELTAVAEESSQSERRAAEAERELVEWKKVRFMSGRLGDIFHALIISTSKYGLFVELEELFVEGLVPIDTLPGDQYTYRENVRKIVGMRTRRQYSIGDRVRVCLDRIDAVERKLHFSLVENRR